MLLLTVGGVERWMTPREARAEGAPYKILDAGEVETLEALGDTLLPGAAESGFANYIDYHLAVPAEDSLLMLRYLDVAPPYASFYKSGLGNLNRTAESRHGSRFAELTKNGREAFVGDMGRENPPGWEGFPAPLFYYALRSDAVDVYYGTVEGFEKLGVPYMPHILPPTKW